MKPKPGHLAMRYAEQFQDTSIVEVYHYRRPYPEEAIEKLVELVRDEPRRVLDVGCGTGDLARRVVKRVEGVDAVDFSRGMIEKGKMLLGGDEPGLRWIYGRVEEVALEGPYALIMAGESSHWMEWEVVFPLFRRLLTPRGYLALAGRTTEQNPWDEELLRLIGRFSTNREFVPYDLTEELTSRELFRVEGALQTRPVPFEQTGEEYIGALHSMNGLSRERMGEEAAQAFDEAVGRVIEPFLYEGRVRLTVVSTVVWGVPLG